MQIAILAGGLATRLRPLTETIPKSMVPILGRPFLQYQLELLRSHGVLDIVLCVGHLWRQIESHFGDGLEFGVRLRYSVEEEMLLGTAGALKKAEPLLEDRFLVMYGDSYLMYDYADIMEKAGNSLALMVVYKNEGRYDSSNAALEGDRVARYEKGSSDPGLVYIDAGLSVLQRKVLESIAPGKTASLDRDLFPPLVQRRQLKAYITGQRFYEVGSLSGLQEFQEMITQSGS